MKECIFCQIINKEIPSDIIFEDNDFVVFKDIKPKAKMHLLLLPKLHVETLNELPDVNLAGKLLLLAKKFASNYRLLINVGRKAGQEIDHLHMHLLANGEGGVND